MRLPTVILALTCLAGAASAEDLSGTLQKVKETKKITLGYQEASVPFSYLDGNQKPIGFAMDICLKIVDAVKKQLGMFNCPYGLIRADMPVEECRPSC